MLTVGSLFSGIGGIELGLEATGGFRTIWQVEINPYCRRILEKHWPEIPKYGDITKLSSDDLERPGLLAGGFPCQDLSTAGLRAGLSGSRSGLWREFLRLIRGLGPRYILVENVAALRYLNRQSGTTEPAAIATVLADLACAGYDAEWASLYAYQFGYPHSRERCFLVAYPDGLGLPQLFDDLPSCPKPCRPGTLGRLDWSRHLLEEFEHRVCQPAVFRSAPRASQPTTAPEGARQCRDARHGAARGGMHLAARSNEVLAHALLFRWLWSWGHRRMTRLHHLRGCTV